MLQKLCSSYLAGKANPVPFIFHHRLIRGLLCFSTAAAAAAKNPSPQPHFMVEYLVSTCGFSPDKAADASKHLNRIKSPHQPDSVLGFFRNHGFDETQIRKLISWNPRWLRLDAEKTLAPKFRSLQDLGFSGPDLTQLILSNPTLIHLSFHRTVLPKIEFWRGLLGSNDLLMRVLKRNHSVLCYSIEKKVLPNLSLLREFGVPDSRIAMIVQKHPRFILQRLDSFRASAERVEHLGIPRSSGMFLWALWVLFQISPENFKAKSELMGGYGWSEADFLSAFRKAPSFVMVSAKVIRDKMDFLVKDAGCEPSYVALYPDLLMYSLEKRLIPRHRVLQLLKSRELHSGEYRVRPVMNLSEKKFMEKYVLRHEEEVPELHELYVCGCKKRGAM